MTEGSNESLRFFYAAKHLKATCKNAFLSIKKSSCIALAYFLKNEKLKMK